MSYRYRSSQRSPRGDDNHWYSSTYWRSNQSKSTSLEVCLQTNHKKVSENRNLEVQADSRLSRPDLRPYTDFNSRSDLRQPSKRSNDCIEIVSNQKRLKTNDPFDSPNSLIKDFRLNRANDGIGFNSVNPMTDFFCKTCKSQSNTSLDYSNHLSGKRHQNVSLESTRVEKMTRLQEKDDCNPLQRLVKQLKEPVFGLNYMKEISDGLFDCNLCHCFKMTVHNAFQHIKGYRHQKNFTVLKETEERRKRSEDRHKKHSERHTVCSSTQTCDKRKGDDSRTKRSKTIVAPGRSSRDRNTTDYRTDHRIPSESQRIDSCKKTIENFRQIREICDQMIGYFSEKQKSSTNLLSAIGETSTVCRASKIKTET